MATKKPAAPKPRRTSNTTAPRQLGPEFQGSQGDFQDRMRGVYKPGANPPMGGWGNPITQIGDALKKLKPKPKPAAPKK